MHFYSFNPCPSLSKILSDNVDAIGISQLLRYIAVGRHFDDSVDNWPRDNESAIYHAAWYQLSNWPRERRRPWKIGRSRDLQGRWISSAAPTKVIRINKRTPGDKGVRQRPGLSSLENIYSPIYAYLFIVLIHGRSCHTFKQHDLNMLGHSDVIWRHRFGSTYPQVHNLFLTDGTKSSPETMLTAQSSDFVAFTWEQFHSECPGCHSMPRVWQLHVQNNCHISKAPISHRLWNVR